MVKDILSPVMILIPIFRLTEIMSLLGGAAAVITGTPQTAAQRPQDETDDTEGASFPIISRPKLDRPGKLLQSYFRHKHIQTAIETYNNAMNRVIPTIIRNSRIDLGGGVVVRFKDVIYNELSYAKEVETPHHARVHGRTYEIEINVMLSIWKDDVEIPALGLQSPIKLCSIPIMVGSDKCVTSRFRNDPVKLSQMGECPNDPQGYFIVNGSSKYVLSLDRLRVNIPLVFFDPKLKSVACRMTCQTVGSVATSLIVISRNKNSIIKMTFGVLKKRVNFFAILDLLYRSIAKRPLEKGIADALILQCLPFDIATDGFSQSKIISLYEITWGKYTQQYQSVLYEYVAKKMDQTGISRDDLEGTVTAKILSSLYPQFPSGTDTRTQKMYLIVQQSNMLVRTLAGFRKLDNRDDWCNKRLESPGRSVYILFGKSFNMAIRRIVRKYSETGRSVVDREMIERLIKSEMSSIRTDFFTSFNTNNWGVSEGSKEHITETSEFGAIGAHSLASKIITPNSFARSTGMRRVGPAQEGYVCVIQTPEGAGCGTTKHLAITTRTTVHEDDVGIQQCFAAFVKEGADYAQGKSFFILNGKFMGWVMGEEFRKYLVEMRRREEIPLSTAITYEKKDNIVYVYTDDSRLSRPLLIVEDGELVVERDDLWDEPFPTLMRRRAVEFVDLRECNRQVVLSESIDNFHRQKRYGDRLRELIQKLEGDLDTVSDEERPEVEGELKATRKILEKHITFKSYTHCEIDPQAIMSMAANHIPSPNHNQGPRNVYQCGMGGGGMTIPGTNYASAMPTTMKVLMGPTNPLVTTQMSYLSGASEMPAGETAVVAITVYDGGNQEDSIIMNQKSLDLGMFRSVVYKTHKIVLENSSTHKMIVGMPLEGKRRYKPEKYRHLNENGLPKVGSVLQEGDVVIGCYRQQYVQESGEESVDDCSETIGIGHKDMVVDTVMLSSQTGSNVVVKVKTKELRIPVVGDKFALRHAQKGTIGIIMKDADMPVITSGPMKGITPDVIFNPHGVPSRMTMGMISEILMGSAAAETGPMDATAFRRVDKDFLADELVRLGYSSQSTYEMMNGTTGEVMSSHIFVGPAYYQVLKHMVEDKIQARALGTRDPHTHGPVGGRNNEGGQRLGEMEVWALDAHGASSIFTDRITNSAPLLAVFCKGCGTMARGDYTTQKYQCVCTQSGKGPGDFVQKKMHWPTLVIMQTLAAAGLGVTLKE